MFQGLNSFPRAKLEENGKLWGKDNVQRTNIQAYFPHKIEAIVFIILQKVFK